MDGPEVPPYFVCPISLEIMKDPVIISTGVSYERDSIDRWLTTYDRNTCPVTKQHLSDRSLTPNSTLRRLIHSWIASARDSFKPSVVVCKPTFDVSEVLRELSQPGLELRSLKRIGTLIHDDAKYRDCMGKAGATSLVASLISRQDLQESTSSIGGVSDVMEAATSLLHLLNPSPEALKQVSESKNGELISSLCLILQRGAYRPRTHAALLLQAIFKVVDDGHKNLLPPDLFDGIVEILKDQNSSRATTIAMLSVLMEVIPHGKNLIKAVQAGAVAVLVELLLEEMEDSRRCEGMLCVLELLCLRAEGRSALLAHPAGVAAVAAKMLRLSHAATERAVKVLLLLCKHCGGCGVVEEMMEVGAVAKLCMVVQVEGSRKTREKAKEIMGLHLKAWNKYPCFPLNCLP